ncbi:MAG: carbon dioxide concentrating mechanism protein CcmL [Pirellulales bacterium]|jgi:microcompartment protein CcmK/EutM|nr:carbon dioxide concentrating mechanism protein CcmL [Pirellulales bacterium]|tara:strand:+ start:151 stop:441 length:291 start_codon:yes stop_codon:yes gene_type:complete
MRIAEVIGTVTLSRSHPSLDGGTFPLAIPLEESELGNCEVPSREELVLYDQLGAGIGSRIALSESREAAAPFFPEKKPVDAYNAALIDQLHLEESD